MTLIGPLVDISEHRGISKRVETIVVRDRVGETEVDYVETADDADILSQPMIEIAREYGLELDVRDSSLNFSRDLFGSDVVRAGRRVGLIVPDGHGRSAGVARGRAFHGRWGPRVGWRVRCCSGEGGPKSLPSFGYRGGPAPGGVDA